ncbi:hypothetical protein NC652_028996 [Populus alba x Populus x berolinensis]|nr:hypothetical protein NC652_028987 [Populus alba x Populus x berolinensis]KAJ6887865.1 hypothetical protein NC652_028996 [Populus alba x Populus x berolinensis]
MPLQPHFSSFGFRVITTLPYHASTSRLHDPTRSKRPRREEKKNKNNKLSFLQNPASAWSSLSMPLKGTLEWHSAAPLPSQQDVTRDHPSPFLMVSPTRPKFLIVNEHELHFLDRRVGILLSCPQKRDLDVTHCRLAMPFMKPKQQRMLSFHFTKSPKQWYQSLFTPQISLANSQHPSPSIDLHHCKDQLVTNAIVSWPIKNQSSSKSNV